MSFVATVYRILIASPSDVPTERKAIADIIHEWNIAHARKQKVVLLPVRWETDVAPEMGSPPQEIINKRILPDCDMLIGVFWTRIGTPTGKSISGTVEEIQQFMDSKRPVMLYWSKRKVEPGSTNTPQYRKLEKFLKSIQGSGIIQRYSGRSDFRTQLTSQLRIRIDSLLDDKEKIKGGTTPARRALQGAAPASVFDKFVRQRENQATHRDKWRQRMAAERASFEAQVMSRDYYGFQVIRNLLALSILPYSPTAKRMDLGAMSNDKLFNMLLPAKAKSIGRIDHHKDSVVVQWPQDRSKPAERMTMLTDRGSLFSVDNWLRPMHNNEPTAKMDLHSEWMFLIEDVRRYLQTFEELKIPNPWTIGISLRICQTSQVILPEGDPVVLASILTRVNRDEAICSEPIVVSSGIHLADNSAVKELLHDAYRDLWRQYGYPNAPKFIDGQFAGFEGR